jgi:hypothetical protein
VFIVKPVVDFPETDQALKSSPVTLTPYELLGYAVPKVIEALYGVPANEAIEADNDLIVGTYDAVDAYEAVPKSEPVIPFVTRREFRAASEPEVMTFFQFGIISFNYGWLHRKCCAHFPYGPII